MTRGVDGREGSPVGPLARRAIGSFLALALFPWASSGRADERLASQREAEAPLGSPGRIRALLRTAGLGEIEFVEPERFGAPDTALAWTSGPLVGLALPEARRERSAAELRQGHVQMFASGCLGPPEARGPRARSVAGYTLVQSTIRCKGEAGGRLTVTTSILDDRDVLTLAHMGPVTEARSLEEMNRALGEALEELLTP